MSTGKMSFLLQQLYDQIPEKVKKEILESKKGTAAKSKTHFRLQFYLLRELYVLLRASGAFVGSETDFFTRLVTTHLEELAFKMGMQNVMAQKDGGR